MPNRSSWPKRTLHDDAVYWAEPTPDGYGDRTFGTPSEIKVRWENREVIFIDPDGEEQVSEAVVYSNQELELGGYLYKGELDDLSSSEQADPFSIASLRQIRGRRGIDNIAGNKTLHTAFLRRGVIT